MECPGVLGHTEPGSRTSRRAPTRPSPTGGGWRDRLAHHLEPSHRTGSFQRRAGFHLVGRPLRDLGGHRRRRSRRIPRPSMLPRSTSPPGAPSRSRASCRRPGTAQPMSWSQAATTSSAAIGSGTSLATRSARVGDGRGVKPTVPQGPSVPSRLWNRRSPRHNATDEEPRQAAESRAQAGVTRSRERFPCHIEWLQERAGR